MAQGAMAAFLGVRGQHQYFQTAAWNGGKIS